MLLTTVEMEVLLFVEGQVTTMTHLEEVLQQNMQELNDRLELGIGLGKLAKDRSDMYVPRFNPHV